MDILFYLGISIDFFFKNDDDGEVYDIDDVIAEVKSWDD